VVGGGAVSFAGAGARVFLFLTHIVSGISAATIMTTPPIIIKSCRESVRQFAVMAIAEFTVIDAVAVFPEKSPLQPVKICRIIVPSGDVTEMVAVEPASYQPAPVGSP
jgi:hypothetical protein